MLQLRACNVSHRTFKILKYKPMYCDSSNSFAQLRCMHALEVGITSPLELAVMATSMVAGSHEQNSSSPIFTMATKLDF